MQIPTVVITPGAQPLTGMALSVANYSGHILKLVPGDHQYEFAQFPIVITWNGTDKFGPTQFLRANVVRDWKLGIVQRHISEALKIFEEVEGDLYDSENPGLFDCFHDLREQVTLTSHILGDKITGRKHTIPPVMFQARRATTSEMTLPVPEGYVPQPSIRHDVDPNIGAPLPPKTTERATSLPQTSQKLFIGFEPQAFMAHFKQDFVLPLDILMSLSYTPSQSALQLFSQVSQSQTQPPQTQTSQSQPSHTQTSQSQPSQSQPSQTQSSQSQPSQTQSSQQSEIESSETEIESSEIVSSQRVPLQPTVFHLDPSQPTSYQKPSSQTKPSQPSQPSQSSQISIPVSLQLPPPLHPSKPPMSAKQAAPSLHLQQAPSTSSSTATSGKKYKCKFCRYETDRKNDWENHCNIHTGLKFPCSSCNKEFSSIKNRTTHFKLVHLKQKRALCPVDKCNFSCNDFGIMKVHQYDDHGIGVEARCKDCNKKFGNFRVYERHIQACNLPKDKECPVCKKAYKSAERLSNHMDTAHKGSPKMICDKCGKIFTSKDSLRMHKANLHGEKVVTRIARVVAQITGIPYTVIHATRISATRVTYTVSVCYASFVACFFRDLHLLLILNNNKYLLVVHLLPYWQ